MPPQNSRQMLGFIAHQMLGWQSYGLAQARDPEDRAVVQKDEVLFENFLCPTDTGRGKNSWAGMIEAMLRKKHLTTSS